MGLAELSLRAAELPVISARLAAMLAGSWTAVFAFRRPLLVVLDRIFAQGRTPPTELRTFLPVAADNLVLAALFAPLAVTDLTALVSADAYALDASPTMGAFVKARLAPITTRA